MRANNSVTLVGRLTRDPEVKDVGETKVAKFGLAVDGYKKDKTNFFDVEIWGKGAEIAEEYITKGKQVSVLGELVQDSWEKDGEKRSKVFIKAEHIMMLGSKSDNAPSDGDSESESEPKPKAKNGKKSAPASSDNEDIPF